MSRRFSNRTSVSHNTEDCFSICLSDLMAGLLSIFILALTFYILNFDQAVSEITSNDARRATLLTEIKDEMLKNNIIVDIDTKQGVLLLPDKLLFANAEATLSKDAHDRIIPILTKTFRDVLRQKEYAGKIETVFIEGHTDSKPIKTYRFRSNWELSTQRAINTWRRMQEIYPEIDKELLNAKNEPLFSCSGYADTRPQVKSDTEEANRQNRRISFRITMTPPSEEGTRRIGE